MIRIAIALTLGLGLPPAAMAQGAKQPETPLSLVSGLPTELAGWRRGDVTDFEQRPGGAGLGAAAEYRPAGGGAGIATVYLYDRGLTDLPVGIASPSVAAELAQATREVELLGPNRRYRVDGRLPAEPVPGPNGAPALRCEQLSLTFEGGNRAESFLCLGVLRGRFLKLRMTLPPGPPGAAAEAVQAVGRGLVAEAAR